MGLADAEAAVEVDPGGPDGTLRRRNSPLRPESPRTTASPNADIPATASACDGCSGEGT